MFTIHTKLYYKTRKGNLKNVDVWFHLGVDAFFNKVACGTLEEEKQRLINGGAESYFNRCFKRNGTYDHVEFVECK